jgi:hypothetical protein
MIEHMTTDIVDQKELAEQLLEQAKEQNRSVSAGLLALMRSSCRRSPRAG